MQRKREGFIIANEHEEFVAGLKVLDGLPFVLWSDLLSQAMIFESQELCQEVLVTLASLYSGRFWEMTIKETETQLILGCDCELLPSWFSS